jgi:hypothetical protein
MRFEGLQMRKMRKFAKTFEFEWHHQRINIGASLRPLLEPDPGDRRIDLSFLNGLRVPGDRFLPSGSLYVRDCMRTVFALFGRDRTDEVDIHSLRTALIGSPGVGKSILCFLAALFHSREKGAIYYRVALPSETLISVFIIFPHQNNNVDVLFTRQLHPSAVKRWAFKDLGIFDLMLQEKLRISRDAYNVYVDGPLHNDETYLLSGEYEYLCTSGGHPLPGSAGLMTLRLWVLDGWTKAEAVEAFRPDTAAVNKAYELCGGNIREIALAMTGPEGENRVKRILDQAIELTLQKEVKLVLTSTTRSANTGDRVRTMFRGPGNDDDFMMAIQIVDSSHVLSCLRRKLGLGAFVESYRFARSLNHPDLQDLHFKEAIHQFFQNISFETIQFCRSTGTAAEGVAQLQSPNVYWVPSMVNFSNIDSAIVYDGTLHVLKMTVKADHDFNLKTFFADFVTPVMEEAPFERQISFHIVVPSGSLFDFGKFEQEMTSQLRQFHAENEVSRALALFPDGRVDIKCFLVYVDMTSVGTVAEALRRLPFSS